MKSIQVFFNKERNKIKTFYSQYTFITLLVSLLVSSPSQWNTHDALTPSRENSRKKVCPDEGLTGNLLGICRAYGEAHCDLVSSNENRTSCERLEYNFREESDGRELSSIFLKTNAEKVIPQEGGVITLSNVAVVEFPMNAFAYPNEVTVSTTKDPALAEEFNEFTSIFRTGVRLAYEIHINTGTEPPLSDFIVVKVVVPAELSSVVPSGSQLEAFAKVESGGDEESHDLFELIPASFDSASHSIVIHLPGAAFSDTRNADNTYEAIITLAVTPGINRTQTSVQ